MIVLVIVGLLIVGYLGYLYTSKEPKQVVIRQPLVIPETALEPVVEEPATEPDVAPAPEPEPEVTETATPAEEEPPELTFVLPRLDDSDQLVRDGAVSLTRHEGINAWLGPNELIRKIVVIVDNTASGSIARRPMIVMAPRSAFSATEISEYAFVMDNSSYNRYNVVTNILVSIDTRRAVEFYTLLQPLFEEAYKELGYPNAKFNDAIFRAIGRLLETPVITEPIRLVRPVVMYEYEDPRLEGLASVQKQMLRMGPRNTQAIQRKLGEVALELRSVLSQ